MEQLYREQVLNDKPAAEAEGAGRADRRLVWEKGPAGYLLSATSFSKSLQLSG